MIKIAPSILSADFSRLGDELRAVDTGGADWIHLDVMDGHFVPNLSIGPAIVGVVNQVTDLFLDTHLMIEDPERFIPAFAEAGSDSISVHAEVCEDLPGVLDTIRRHGCRTALAINPDTPLSAVAEHLERIDMLLLMSVNPGFGAQAFIPAVLDKIAEAHRWRREHGLSYLIEIDGGVKLENADRVGEAGVDVIVSGSGIFGKSDYGRIIADMRQAAENAAAARPSPAGAAAAP